MVCCSQNIPSFFLQKQKKKKQMVISRFPIKVVTQLPALLLPRWLKIASHVLLIIEQPTFFAIAIPFEVCTYRVRETEFVLPPLFFPLLLLIRGNSVISHFFRRSSFLCEQIFRRVPLMVMFRFEQRFLRLRTRFARIYNSVFMLAEQPHIFSSFSSRITKVAESRNRLIIEDSHLSLVSCESNSG